MNGRNQVYQEKKVEKKRLIGLELIMSLWY